MSAREWIPPMARFTSIEPETELWLEMKASWALESTWRACMGIYQDGGEYEVHWNGFAISVYRRAL